MVEQTFIEAIWSNLTSYTSTDIVLPFLVIFILLFLGFKKSGFVGENGIVYFILAVIISTMVIIPHVTGDYPPGKDVVEIFNNTLPQASIAIVSLFLLLIFIGAVGGGNGSKLLPVGLAIIGVGGIMLFFFGTEIDLNSYAPGVSSFWIIAVIVGFILLWALTRDRGLSGEIKRVLGRI